MAGHMVVQKFPKTEILRARAVAALGSVVHLLLGVLLPALAERPEDGGRLHPRPLLELVIRGLHALGD